MVESKPSGSPKGVSWRDQRRKIKGQASKPKRYRIKNTRSKTQGQENKADTKLKGGCSDMKVYVFNFGSRSSENFTRTMKELKRYLVVTYSIICQT